MLVMESLVLPLYPYLLPALSSFPCSLGLALYSNMERLGGAFQKAAAFPCRLIVWSSWKVGSPWEHMGKPCSPSPGPALAALILSLFSLTH